MLSGLTSRKMDKPLVRAHPVEFRRGQDGVAGHGAVGSVRRKTYQAHVALPARRFLQGAASLKHKALSLEEGDGVEEATYAIRNLISAGELIIESTIKDPATGRLTTMANRVEGPTAVFHHDHRPGNRPGNPEPVLRQQHRREPGADAGDTDLSTPAADAAGLGGNGGGPDPPEAPELSTPLEAVGRRQSLMPNNSATATTGCRAGGTSRNI